MGLIGCSMMKLDALVFNYYGVWPYSECSGKMTGISLCNMEKKYSESRMSYDRNREKEIRIVQSGVRAEVFQRLA